MFENEHVKAREIVVNINHPLAEESGVNLLGSPMKFSGTPVTYRFAPPTIGQHTEEILREKLELTDEDLSALRKKSVI